jgi:GMP synthase (glutamine-hydrolysing)
MTSVFVKIKDMKILIVRHTEGNSLGHLEPVLPELGLDFAYFDAFGIQPDDFPDLAAFSGLVLLGGFQHVYDEVRFPLLRAEKAWIRRAIDAEKPIFGICLGAQLIASALGARVSRMPEREVGWSTITLTPNGLQDPVFRIAQSFQPFRQFQWHEDTFEVPSGGLLLASSGQCAQQAFRFGPQVLAVQFHPEVLRETAESWINGSKRLSAEQAAAIRAETQTAYEVQKRHSQALFRQFWKESLLARELSS